MRQSLLQEIIAKRVPGAHEFIKSPCSAEDTFRSLNIN